MPSQIADYAHDAWAGLLEHYVAIRRLTEDLAARLSPEDQCVQLMPDASPAKWHLGHTAWFFETFILERFDAGYKPFDRGYSFLFNSVLRRARAAPCPSRARLDNAAVRRRGDDLPAPR